MSMLFDRALLRSRRLRAAEGFAAHDFLQALMAERLRGRLADFTQEFKDILWIGGGGEGFPGVRIDSAALPGAQAVAEEEALPFASARFDAVLCCNRLHWVNDIPHALAEMRRVLKQDGLFLAMFPGGETLHELRDAMLRAMLAQEGGAAPRISPFVDVRDGGALLQRAGFGLPVADSETLRVRYADAQALMRELRGMGEANALIARPRAPLKRATLAAIAEEYVQRYRGEDGRIAATFELIGLSGWAV